MAEVQHTATHCNTHCNTMQVTTTYCNTLEHTVSCLLSTATRWLRCNTRQLADLHDITLQRTATQCGLDICVWQFFAEVLRQDGEMQHTTMQCSTLENTQQHTATNCHTLQHTATCLLEYCYNMAEMHHAATHCNALQRTATHGNTHSNTLQHTATHYDTLRNSAPFFSSTATRWLRSSTLQRTAAHSPTHCNERWGAGVETHFQEIS